MKLNILVIIIVYYALIGLFFTAAASDDINVNDYSSNVNLNDSELTDSEIDTGGVFSSGVSFLRFTGFLLFGITIGIDAPAWFAVMFALWQTSFTLFTIGFIISSAWDG